jgi:hypothetical protein
MRKWVSRFGENTGHFRWSSDHARRSIEGLDLGISPNKVSLHCS